MSMKSNPANWLVRTYPKVAAGTKAFVLPGAFYGQCILLMAEAGYERADSVAEADVVVFIGGADINPVLYGQADVASSFSIQRDDFEVEMYKRAQELGKVCFGICRGAQFLHAMNGGVLWQDVNNHAGPPHDIFDLDENCILQVTSMHHQMLQDNDTLEVIAVAAQQTATKFLDENMEIDLKARGSNNQAEIEIEAGCYHATKCFFVQGHPEVGSLYYRTWTMSKLYDLMAEWAPATGKSIEAALPPAIKKDAT